jgi:hypothetical protein
MSLTYTFQTGLLFLKVKRKPGNALHAFMRKKYLPYKEGWCRRHPTSTLITMLAYESPLFSNYFSVRQYEK